MTLLFKTKNKQTKTKQELTISYGGAGQKKSSCCLLYIHFKRSRILFLVQEFVLFLRSESDGFSHGEKLPVHDQESKFILKAMSILFLELKFCGFLTRRFHQQRGFTHKIIKAVWIVKTKAISFQPIDERSTTYYTHQIIQTLFLFLFIF